MLPVCQRCGKEYGDLRYHRRTACTLIPITPEDQARLDNFKAATRLLEEVEPV